MKCMFTTIIEDCLESTDSSLDDRLREIELQTRKLQAERAGVLTVIEGRGSYAADGQRSTKGYLRSTCNLSDNEANKRRLVATVCNLVPELGEWLYDGRIGEVQIIEIARIHQNPRTKEFFPLVAGVYLEFAEHDSHDELKGRIDDFITVADQDGAFTDLVCNIAQRTASAHVVGGTLSVRVSGGDPVDAAEFVEIFDTFVEREFHADVEARREEHGDDADGHQLPRSDRQRRHDAMLAMARAGRDHVLAGKSGDAAETTVNVVSDPRTLHDTFEDAGLVTTDDGKVAELDDDLIDDVIELAGSDPDGWLDRRCELADGTPIHPMVLLRAALFGHIRRVLVNSEGEVVDLGRRKRLFEGPARTAAKLLLRSCSHPGCSVKVTYAEVDHIEEWHEGGRTDQRNADVRCRAHNRFKHRERWTTKRDEHGRRFSIRPDGSIVLPVGARAPDLSADELKQIARARLADLRPTA